MKIQKAQYNLKLRKINIILGLGKFTPTLFLRILLKKISIEKDLFLKELEQGNEVLIPKALS